MPPTDRDIALQDKFLGALIERRGVTADALKDTNVSRPTFYRWLREDEAFRKRYDEHRLALAEEIESEAIKRVLSPEGQRGSDQLTTTLLRGLKKERYAEKDTGGPNVAIVYVSNLRANPRPGLALPAPEQSPTEDAPVSPVQE